jgi:cytoplasmic iron level regulating protein YaaA (DUF328/UPF0246 family)
MRRPVILLPPSKGKAAGGSGPAYARTFGRHPLVTARTELLEAAVASASERDATVLVRRCGVAASAASATRTMLRGLAAAPTMPAQRRYTGIVHGNAGLAQLDVAAMAVDVRIVSPLMGLVALDEPVPAYRLEFTATLPGLGSVANFWRDRLCEELLRVAGGARVWDLLPGEHARMWPVGLREELDVVGVRFVRPDGRAANAARTKVAKGLLAAHLIATPRSTAASVVRATGSAAAKGVAGPLGAGWEVALDEDGLVATYVGE